MRNTYSTVRSKTTWKDADKMDVKGTQPEILYWVKVFTMMPDAECSTVVKNL